MICTYLSLAIDTFDDNALLITNKIFGFILNKKEQIPKESDPGFFIYTNIFLVKKFSRKASKGFKKRNIRSKSQTPKSSLKMHNLFNQSQNNIPYGHSFATNSQPRPIVYFESHENTNIQNFPNYLSPTLNIYRPTRNYTPTPILNDKKI